MIELSTTNAQTLAAGQSIIFDTVLLHTGCAECYRANTSSIILTQKNAIYEISFNSNIGATTAGQNAQLGITLDNSILQETDSIVPTATAGDLTNVAAATYIKTCWCGGTNSILLTNTGTTEITVGKGARLSVKRIA